MTGLEVVLRDQTGNEILVFTTGQTTLPGGGQVKGRVESVDNGLLTLSTDDDDLVHIVLAHVVRVTFPN